MYKHQENFVPFSLAWDILFFKPLGEGEHHIAPCSAWNTGLFLLWYQENPRYLMVPGDGDSEHMQIWVD